jgi:hypothetical protein
LTAYYLPIFRENRNPARSGRALRAGVAPTRFVPGPWGQMRPGEILERSAMVPLVHTWDLGLATGQVALPDPSLVRDAPGPARYLAMLLRWPGDTGPECAVPADAGDLTRLLAIFGRRIADGQGSS